MPRKKPRKIRSTSPSMLRALPLFSLVLFSSCSSSVVKDSGFPSPLVAEKEASPAPDSDGVAESQGQIPEECETLLNKSREWGFVPGNSWLPSDRAIALEALNFFENFHLVPEVTSNIVARWMREESPKDSVSASSSLSKMERAQTCDLSLAHRLLLSLLNYSWNKKEKSKVAQAFLRFVLNQQARVMSSMARAVQMDILEKAVRKGLIRVPLAKLVPIRKWFDEENRKGLARAERTEDPMEQWILNQDELKASEEARSKLSQILPLP